MSDIKFDCPQCGTHLAVDVTGAGMTVACPNCGQAILVPELARLAHKGSLARVKWWLLSAGVAAAMFVAGLLVWQTHRRPTLQTESVPISTPAASKPRELALYDSQKLASDVVSHPPVEIESKTNVAEHLKQVKELVPVQDINDAVVFTFNELSTTSYALDLAQRSGSDVLIRGWFKWGQAPRYRDLRNLPAMAHRFGALFGGGVTCAALYDNENGLSRQQVLDMATRGLNGQLIDAYGKKVPDWKLGIRHGSLSNPAYLDYIFHWCQEQIDAGADYLFMDEASKEYSELNQDEGYDDYSLKDFQLYLPQYFQPTLGWSRNDSRWNTQFKIDMGNKDICPDGTMASFNYRVYVLMRSRVGVPPNSYNPMEALWEGFIKWRDDRAWKSLTDRIRTYARYKGRSVFISANGLARYVDLQVLGIWPERWLVKDGQVDLTQNQLPIWHSLVLRGQDVAEKRVPVVLFHDAPPFLWETISPQQRVIWLRTRAAEIYAAGAFFAFPVLAWNYNAERDGTLATIIKQTSFYHNQRTLYFKGQYLASECLHSDSGNVSLSIWFDEDPNTLALHIINREMNGGELVHRHNVLVDVPLNRVPDQAGAVSPDWPGEQPVTVWRNGNNIRVKVDDLEAYAVVRLRYRQPMDVSRLKDSVRAFLARRWERPSREEFHVLPDGRIQHADELNGIIQGMLHTHLRNPPTFLVNAITPSVMRVHVSSVALTGARLVVLCDGHPVRRVDLPDIDGKSDANAAEYDYTLNVPIPTGPHRVTIDNDGADFLVLNWIEFTGEFK